MNMEVLNLLINPKISTETCFLCFKQHDDLKSIYSDIVIITDGQEFTVSVFRIMAYLFSLHDTILHQVCDKCSEVVIHIFTLIQKHKVMKQNINKFTQSLEKEMAGVQTTNKRCYLKIHAPEEKISPSETLTNNHEIFNKNFQQCPKCDMTFDSKELLLEHTKIAHKNTNDAVICHICGKLCRTPSSLNAHFNCHKEKQCPYCLKMLKTHSHYKIHVRNHVSTTKRKRNQTAYKCHGCNFKSLNKGSLEAHINKAHLGLRPHVCPICYKGFFKKSNLTEHISIHDKVKTETCEICGDSFGSKRTRLEHLRLHKNETPYKCDICSKSFVTSGRRSDHVKRKHMEKMEGCLICNKMFSLKKELNRHVKKIHWQNDVPGFAENIDNGHNNTEMIVPFS